LNVILIDAKYHDLTQFMLLLDGLQPIAGQRGRPLRKPQCVQADRGYDCEAYRRVLRECGIELSMPLIIWLFRTL
jgi:hypothetical protein